MRVSIIIPYTTGIQILKDCLDSLEKQSYQDFEVILIQDQLPNELYDEDRVTTIESVKDQLSIYSFEIKYIELEDNQGVASCRNLGIANATGEYLYFLDMDDYLLDNTLECMLANQTNPDVIYGSFATTWFKRLVFLQKLDEAKKEDRALDYIKDEDDLIQCEIQKEQVDDDSQHMINLDLLDEDTKTFVQMRLMNRRGFKSITALHMLIRKSFLAKHNICFEEKFKKYSDMIFVTNIIKHLTSSLFVPEAYYIKRRRNNPVQYPSIHQLHYDESFSWLIGAYQQSKDIIEKDEVIRDVFDQKMINYFCNYFVKKMRRSEMPYWREERFEIMKGISQSFRKDLILCQNHYKKTLIHALQKGQLKRTLIYVTTRLGFAKLKKLRKNRNLLSVYLYEHYFLKMSVKQNYIMCETFLGRNYADSPKAIFEYMSEHNKGEYQFVWSVDKKMKFPYPCKVVKRFGIRYAYYLARSKYFVFNMRQPSWMRKREGTVFLQTWHGTPLKKLVYDQEEVLSATPLYKQQVYKQSRCWDYLISDNHFSTEAFRSAFLYQNKRIIEAGYPRNDLLYRKDQEEIAKQIKAKLGISEDKKVILYAPTWRDDEYYDKGKYKFSLAMDLAKYKEALGEEYVLLIRTHYFIADQLDLEQYKGFAVNVSKYDDITELYLITDICITDYSSVFFDFANLRRPILFYMYDLSKYRDVLRGFYLDIEKEVPGPILLTDDDVIDAILKVDDIVLEYKEKYNAFYQRFCSLDDGQATKRIVEQVFRIQ